MDYATDVKTIMRRGAGSCRAEVDFIGCDRVRYSAKWEARRARERANGAFRPQSVSLQNIDSGEMMSGRKTEVLSKIAERVGLSFDQFRRSVLLAQGDFAAFLKADANERAELLERMTGTEIYAEVSIAAYQRMRAEEATLDGLVEELTRLQVMDAAQRASREGELAGIGFRLDDEKCAHEQATAAVRWFEYLAALGKSVTFGAEEVVRATRLHQECEPRRVQLGLIKAAEPFRAAVEGVDRVARQLDEGPKKCVGTRVKRDEAVSIARDGDCIAHSRARPATAGAPETH